MGLSLLTNATVTGQLTTAEVVLSLNAIFLQANNITETVSDF